MVKANNRGTSRSHGKRSRAVGEPSGLQSAADLADIAARVAVALGTVQVHGLVVTACPGNAVRLEGTVRTESDVREAGRRAKIPGVGRVENQLSVDPTVGSMPVASTILSPELAALIELTHDEVAPGTEIDLNKAVGTTDTAEATDEAEPYFAPTDPPTRRASREQQGIEVVGGFSRTSLDSPIELEQLPTPLLTGDDELAREVRLALMEDAATADLNVRVNVRNRIVYLRGVVQSINEAELAEEVASRVPNVEEVIENLVVSGL